MEDRLRHVDVRTSIVRGVSYEHISRLSCEYQGTLSEKGTGFQTATSYSKRAKSRIGGKVCSVFPCFVFANKQAQEAHMVRSGGMYGDYAGSRDGSAV